jgi:hypothetical protein
LRRYAHARALLIHAEAPPPVTGAALGLHFMLAAGARQAR